MVKNWDIIRAILLRLESSETGSIYGARVAFFSRTVGKKWLHLSRPTELRISGIRSLGSSLAAMAHRLRRPLGNDGIERDAHLGGLDDEGAMCAGSSATFAHRISCASASRRCICVTWTCGMRRSRLGMCSRRNLAGAALYAA